MHKKEEEEHRDPKVVYFCCFIKCDVIFLKCLYEVDLEISELRLTRIVQKILLYSSNVYLHSISLFCMFAV